MRRPTPSQLGPPIRHPQVVENATSLYGIPGVVCATSSSLPLTASTAYYMPFVVLRRILISTASIYVAINSSTAGAKVRMAIYNQDGSGQPTSLVADIGEFDVKTSTGKVSVTGLSIALEPGHYLIRIQSDASATQATLGGLRGNPITGPWISDNALNNYATILNVALAYGAAESPGTAWNTYTNATTPMVYAGFFLWSTT